MAVLARLLRRSLPVAVLMALHPGTVAAQDQARLRIAENFRRAPNGDVLGRLEPAAGVVVLQREGSWVRVRLEGWVWTRSLQMANREGMDLVVFVDGGENIRAEPSGRGTVLGRLAEGTLLEELERRPGWIRVRREGWLWAASLSNLPAASPTAPAGQAAAAPPPAPTGQAAAPSPAPSTAEAEVPAARRPSGFTTAGRAGAAILAAPGGDTLARARPAAELEVVSRQGNWARVRLEGWTWLPPDTAAAPAGGQPARALSPADVSADPAGARGRMVTWTLQFISLERAERVRTDFFEGEPFLLTRFGGTSGPFVYVAIPVERVTEMEGLVPLETVEVTGRVRTGSSALTGSPILDLVSFRRTR